MKNLASKSLLIICVALAVLLFKECEANKECQAYDEPTGLIEQSVAEQYHLAYKIEVETGNINVDDNHEVWFKLDELENYIKYVKKNAEDEGLTDLGMRVYLGSLNNETNVFFAPTHSEITRTQDDSDLSRKNTSSSALNMGDPGKVVYP
ncbi:hypothetical protein [Lacinutrix sp.]|uniref:hypothetical protein n=1 Tax=Lacinutrix sp. TaxID=1937692 RepID=UPI0025BCE6A2|nr:hypothetical protein [Lacinutrix sp.]